MWVPLSQEQDSVFTIPSVLLPTASFSSVQFSRSVTSDSLRPMDCSTPGFPVLITCPQRLIFCLDKQMLNKVLTVSRLGFPGGAVSIHLPTQKKWVPSLVQEDPVE